MGSGMEGNWHRAAIDLFVDGCHACRVEALWVEVRGGRYEPMFYDQDGKEWRRAGVSTWSEGDGDIEDDPRFVGGLHLSGTGFDAFCRAVLDCQGSSPPELFLEELAGDAPVPVRFERADYESGGSHFWIGSIPALQFAHRQALAEAAKIGAHVAAAPSEQGKGSRVRL